MDRSKMSYQDDLMTLVKMIEERPCLWDKYTIREPGEKKRAWREICQQFAPISLDEMDEEAIKKLEGNIQNKWKNLRDAFIKAAKTNYTKYKFYDNLKFLLKILDAKKPQSLPPEETSVSKRGRPRKRRNFTSFTSDFGLIKKRPVLKKTVHVAPLVSTPEKIKKEFLNDLLPSPEATSNMVVGKSRMENAVPDEDEAFFFSIMPSVKKLSDDEKLEFRMNVINIIREINMRRKMMNTPNGGNTECSNIIFMSDENFEDGDVIVPSNDIN